MNAYLETLLSVSLHVPCRHFQFQRHILPAILHRIVKQIEYHIGEMHLIDIHGRLLGSEECLYMSAVFLHLELESRRYAGYDLVGVHIL